MANLILTGDTSGTITLSAPLVAGSNTATLPASTGNVLLDTTVGVCRAWVNFNGTGTVAIRASFNVSSITDNGTGDYTVNFTNAMSDANYQYSGSFSPNYGAVFPAGMAINTNTAGTESTPTTSAFRVVCVGVNSSFYDPKYVNIAIFR